MMLYDFNNGGYPVYVPIEYNYKDSKYTAEECRDGYAPAIPGVGCTGPIDFGNVAYYHYPSSAVGKSEDVFSFLYLRDVTTREMIYKNNVEEWMFENDPTLTGVEAINVDLNDGQVEYYDLMGCKVTHPTKGIYIIKSGGKARKVMIK